jgi:hypothetical protein
LHLFKFLFEQSLVFKLPIASLFSELIRFLLVPVSNLFQKHNPVPRLSDLLPQRHQILTLVISTLPQPLLQPLLALTDLLLPLLHINHLLPQVFHHRLLGLKLLFTFEDVKLDQEQLALELSYCAVVLVLLLHVLGQQRNVRFGFEVLEQGVRDLIHCLQGLPAYVDSLVRFLLHLL